MDTYYGFVYQWTDSKNGFKYIGSHYGNLDDGYVSSNVIVNRIYKSRPSELHREVLEYLFIDDKKELHSIEQKYLDTIDDSEIYSVRNRRNSTCKFYNMKKQASGGNGVGSNGKMKNTKKYYHKDTLVQRFFSTDEIPSDEWIKGVPSVKASSLHTRWYHHRLTFENKRLVEPLSDEWVLGRNKPTTPKKVSTPYGIFESAAECSRVTGIKKGTVTFRCRSESEQMEQWFYIKDKK